MNYIRKCSVGKGADAQGTFALGLGFQFLESDQAPVTPQFPGLTPNITYERVPIPSPNSPALNSVKLYCSWYGAGKKAISPMIKKNKFPSNDKPVRKDFVFQIDSSLFQTKNSGSKG